MVAVSETWRPPLTAPSFLAGAFASWAGHTNGEIPRASPPHQARDVLADVASVLGDAVHLLSEKVLHCLKNLSPRDYGAWTTASLKAAFEPHGAEARPYGERRQISARVLEAIAERDAASDPEQAAPGQ